MSQRRVLFYVQHLLGIGHLKRAATLARAMQKADLDVTVVSGGGEIPGLELGGAEFVQLPPTRATDLFFKELVDEDNAPIDDDWKERRRDALLETFARLSPHVLMIELFPFGRRQMRFELEPLLDAAIASAPRPVIVSSVRDILVAQHKAGRNDEMLMRVERWFDHVLVHGDPDFIPFDKTFPHARRIAGRIRYTGYVVDSSGKDSDDYDSGRGEVIVSAGGGAAGIGFLKDALGARALGAGGTRHWRVLVGINVAPADFDDITALAQGGAALAQDSSALAPGGVTVERARNDFPVLLRNCDLSLSQGGYNTVMEVLEGSARAVIVPYAGGIETEQTLRARVLAERGGIHVLDEARCSPERLAAAAAAALAAPPPHPFGLDTGGAGTTARLVCELAGSVV